MKTNKPTILTIVLILQLVCAAFFFFDAITDWLGLENIPAIRQLHSFELVMALTMLAGIAVTIWALRHVLRQQKLLRRQIQMASGAFSTVIDQAFSDWALTTAESDIALMAIKGFSTADMAQVRSSKEGTVKAQAAAVYRKANVANRLQLLSLFIDELLENPVLDTHKKGPR